MLDVSLNESKFEFHVGLNFCLTKVLRDKSILSIQIKSSFASLTQKAGPFDMTVFFAKLLVTVFVSLVMKSVYHK